MSVLKSLEDALESFILSREEMRGGEPVFHISPENLRLVCEKLKSDFGFVYLSDITAVDYLGERAGERFEVVHNIVRFDGDYNEELRVFLKSSLDSPRPQIDSVTPIWKGADWLEREVFDMFGIKFSGHPNMRRILLSDDYEGSPLRKDFDVRNREPAKRSFQKALEEGNF